MDRDKLLREAAVAAQVLAESAIKITRQRTIVVQSRLTADAEAVLRAEQELETLLEQQSRLQENLTRIQGELIFSG